MQRTEDGMSPEGREPAIKVLMMPRDANVHDTIFGGVILSHIDQAGAVHTRREGCERVVTIAMDAVEFKLPVFVGDVVSFYCRTLEVGRTSIQVHVDVWAQRFPTTTDEVRVTEAEVTYVNIGEDRKPLPVPRS
ncbi:MAG: acyl-CoA thioesterase [Planctomycetota bacterium]|jgi:acyl-CoA thioesterase YciA